MSRIHFACSVALLTLSALTAPAWSAEWGALRGRILLDGEAPAATKVQITKNDPYCAGKSLTSEQLVVNSETGGVSNVAVWLYVKRNSRVPTSHPSYETKLKEPVILKIASCRFTPHMVFVRSGQPFEIRNTDKVVHNFEVAFGSVGRVGGDISAGKEFKKVFSGRETQPAPVLSRTRPWMTAFVLVQDHPYVAVSNASGEFVIEDLPAGKWIFQFWHERSGYLAGATVGDQQTIQSRGLIELVIKPGDNDLGDIKLQREMLKLSLR